MKRLLRIFLLTVVFAALLVVPGHALEYSINAPEDYLFGRPTSDDTIYEWENPNVDRAKNAALIPPGFGTPTSSAQAAYLSLPADAESSLTPLLLLSPQSLGGRLCGGPMEAQRSGFHGGRRSKGANAVFAAGGNGVERTLRRRAHDTGHGV